MSNFVWGPGKVSPLHNLWFISGGFDLGEMGLEVHLGNVDGVG